jgi:hypothetical protein
VRASAVRTGLQAACHDLGTSRTISAARMLGSSGLCSCCTPSL